MRGDRLAGLRQTAADAVRDHFGHDATHLGYAPGRVELLGNHTDYNGGSVICAALDLGTLVAGRRNGLSCMRLWSAQRHDDVPVEQPLDSITPHSASRWADYVRGVVVMAKEAGVDVPGFDLAVVSDLPMGSGLSSSASFELATLHLLLALAGERMPPMDAAKLCRRAENQFVGVPSGLMDQFAAAHGQAGHALFLDCHTLDHEALPLGDDVAIVIFDSRTHHALADGQYAKLRVMCESAARKVNRAHGREGPEEHLLRHVSAAELEEHVPFLDADELARARHVLQENARVLAGRQLLRSQDAIGFAALMSQSHVSSRDLFGNSCAELDQCVDIAKQVSHEGSPCAGAWMGGKLSGGGFGGATVNLVRAPQAEAFVAAVSRAFEQARGVPARVIVAKAGPGALGLAL